jgi:hypothetical protein
MPELIQWIQQQRHQQQKDHDDNMSTVSPTVVAMDINGTREVETVQQCLQNVLDAWQPRLVIIKSRQWYNEQNKKKRFFATTLVDS